tara:strand:+ start:345 stop:554 length:210 start_codon:yes stop_codon:yes gene_type:complete
MKIDYSTTFEESCPFCGSELMYGEGIRYGSEESDDVIVCVDTNTCSFIDDICVEGEYQYTPIIQRSNDG